MRDSRTASRKIALCAMLMALAMIFSYVEVLIPINSVFLESNSALPIWL